jgi:hypothetical protein
MRRTESGLWIAPSFNVLRFRKREKTITLPNGERAKVTVDDSGTVRHTEHGDHLDALVRPAPIHVKMHVEQVAAAVGGFGRPNPIRTRFKLKDRRHDQSR